MCNDHEAQHAVASSVDSLYVSQDHSELHAELTTLREGLREALQNVEAAIKARDEAQALTASLAKARSGSVSQVSRGSCVGLCAVTLLV